MITKIDLINTEINIKVNNLLNIHLNELVELIIKLNKMRKDFNMS